MPPKPRPVLDRLLARVDKTDTCWLWQGATVNGYGRIGTDSYRTGLVHRVLFEQVNGPIPPGMHLDHLCRDRRCVNPEHLEVVTQAENNRRSWMHRRSESCKRGHMFTPENTVWTGPGRSMRNCRTCRNAAARARRAAVAA